MTRYLPVAEVRISDDLTRLVITPRVPNEFNLVGRILKQTLGDIRLYRSASGITIPSEEADRVRDIGDNIDLRWREDASIYVENRIRAKGVRDDLLKEVKTIRENDPGLARKYLTDIRGLDILDEHQVVNVAAMTLPHSYGLCVFDEQGAGKTVTLIYAFDVLVARDQVDFALIVAPKSMVPEWQGDFSRFKGDMYRVRIVSGTRREKQRALRSGMDILVTNFETVASMEDDFKALFRGYGQRGMLVIDESFFIKNLDTKRTRALRRLREYCGPAYVLCGTPAPNSPHDIIQQFNIVDYGITFAGVDVPDDRAQALTVVKELMDRKGLYIRHLKKDVLPDLPPKRFNRILIQLQPEQERLYAGALQDLILDLQSTDDKEFVRRLTSYLAKRSALLQICSNPISIVDDYSETPAKLLALDELLDEFIAKHGEKVVLWSFFTASIDALTNRYEKYDPLRYDGKVSSVQDRGAAVRKFQDDDQSMLFIGNPAAAGAGLTLHRSRIAIYESMSNQAAHYLQSLDRIHRRGQTRDVEYVILLCEKSIEIEEYERLMSKERSAQSLLGDDVEPVITRDQMLSELLSAKDRLGEGR